MRYTYGETLTVEAPGGYDRWGNPIPGETMEVQGFFWPQGSVSGQDGYVTDQDQMVLPGGTVFPSGDPVTAECKIYRNKGTGSEQMYALDAEPLDYRSPFTGWSPGMVCSVTEGVA